MDTEIREWFNDIWAYCEENWVAVAALAAVVLLVLLSIVLVCSAKREDRKALQEMAEAESEPALEPDSNPEEPAEEPAIAELAEPVSEEPAEPAEEPEAEIAAEPAEETAGEPAEEAAEETVLQESAMNMVDSLVKSMESAAGASGQKVESIELKIEKAQLTIHYAGGEKKTVSEGLLTELPVPEAETAASEWADISEPENQPETTYFAENAGRTKRFGFDNMNTARSGRVYTEEELLNQIRD